MFCVAQTVILPLYLYSALAIAQRKPQRISGRELHRIDVLVDNDTYEHICSIHSAFLADSVKHKYHKLSLSEVMRTIIATAMVHDSEVLHL